MVNYALRCISAVEQLAPTVSDIHNITRTACWEALLEIRQRVQ